MKENWKELGFKDRAQYTTADGKWYESSQS